eukprot:COSAG02_NODE_146_length_33985_cov_263.461695_11_plen_135_part_00
MSGGERSATEAWHEGGARLGAGWLRTAPFLFALEIFPSGFRRFAAAAPPASDAAARLLRRARAFSAIDAAAADALRDALRVRIAACRVCSSEHAGDTFQQSAAHTPPTLPQPQAAHLPRLFRTRPVDLNPPRPP